MATDTLAVILEGRPIATLERNANGQLRLRYDDNHHQATHGVTPLSVSMPPGSKTYGSAQITPWLWGLLPDNGDVLAKWGRDFGVSVASPFSLLGTPIGRDCPGAVQFCPVDDVDDLLNRPGRVSWLDDAEMAARLRSLRADATGWLGPGNTGQFSLGGAQAKMALHYRNGRWGVPTGSTPTTHILKPAIAGLEDQHLNEHLCLATARLLGLPAAETSVQAFEDQAAVVVQRFDRTTKDGKLVRVHQEDFCQALSVAPVRKYQADGGPNPARMAELIRRAIPHPGVEIDVWRFADALAYNWLLAGTDAHAKNYGLLLSGNQVRLAPLYDISSYLPYDDSKGNKIKLAMKLGGEYQLRRTNRSSTWERVAGELRLDPDRLRERVADLARRTPDALTQAIDELEPGVAECSDLPGRLLELATDRCGRCLSVLD